ncbi:hypothetical protein B5K03_09520 [Rhizobium phaseoli]|nr:hypothetical protein B5K03_09520 [Rhizobium phaseoli]
MSSRITEFESEIPDDSGLWLEDLTHGDWSGLPGLFLDRDGVILEETGYLGTPEKLRLIDGAAEAIRIGNSLGIPVVLVTNQSGIGRGYYTWDDFANVQNELYRQLSLKGSYIDFVAACAYHAAATFPFSVPSHPWRKPNPGMILAVAKKAGLILHESTLIGDRWSDMEAAANAGLTRGILVRTGLGGSEAQFSSQLGALDMRVDFASSISTAMKLLLEEQWPRRI